MLLVFASGVFFFALVMLLTGNVLVGAMLVIIGVLFLLLRSRAGAARRGSRGARRRSWDTEGSASGLGFFGCGSDDGCGGGSGCGGGGCGGGG